MKRDNRQSEAQHLKQQAPKARLVSKETFRHRDRGMRMGRVRAG